MNVNLFNYDVSWSFIAISPSRNSKTTRDRDHSIILIKIKVSLENTKILRLFNKGTITRHNMDTCICEIFFVGYNLLLSNFCLNLKQYYINCISEDVSHEYFLS